MDSLYLHGLPGGAAELAFANAELPVLPRTEARSWKALAATLPQGQTVHLIGFSLGAAAVLRLAALAPERIGRVTLISPAAPLELGDFLPHMAGRTVFRMARQPWALRAFTLAQAGLARVAPHLLATQLRATCDPGDRALLARPEPNAAFCRALQQGYGENRQAYLREVTDYVAPWAGVLRDVTCPVDLHHGRADRWAPPGMSEALATHLREAELTWHRDLGHYGTLARVLGQIA